MSSLIAAPELISAAATDLRTIGSTLSEAHAASAAWTVTVVPAAEDEVSAATVSLFSKPRPTVPVAERAGRRRFTASSCGCSPAAERATPAPNSPTPRLPR
jgi:PE family